MSDYKTHLLKIWFASFLSWLFTTCHLHFRIVVPNGLTMAESSRLSELGPTPIPTFHGYCKCGSDSMERDWETYGFRCSNRRTPKKLLQTLNGCCTTFVLLVVYINWTVSGKGVFPPLHLRWQGMVKWHEIGVSCVGTCARHVSRILDVPEQHLVNMAKVPCVLFTSRLIAQV